MFIEYKWVTVTWASLSRGYGQYMFPFTSDSVGHSKLCELWDYRIDRVLWTRHFLQWGWATSGAEDERSKTGYPGHWTRTQIYMGLFTLLTIPSWWVFFPPTSSFPTACWQSTAEMPHVAQTELFQAPEAAQILYCAASWAFMPAFFYTLCCIIPQLDCF